MARATLAFSLVMVSFPCAALAAAACSHATPELTSSGSSSAAVDAGPLPVATIDAGRLTRDPGGRFDASGASSTALPKAPPPRDPTWDLDPKDPARDYVVRYIRATQRYADKTACVTVLPSTDNGSRKQVGVVDDPKSTCFANGGADPKARDVFVVDVEGDRLSSDDPATRAALRKWPDGSDPEGPAAAVETVENNKFIKGPLREALVALKQGPLRLQLYGRGSYPVFSIAGWHDPIKKELTEMPAVAQQLCAASHNQPMGIYAGVDRTLLLRVRCPGIGPQSPTPPTTVWENMKP